MADAAKKADPGVALDIPSVVEQALPLAALLEEHAEFVLEVPYRHTLEVTVDVRNADGSITRGQKMTDYQPKPGDDGAAT